MTDNEDIYGSLGREWWEKTGEEVRATPQQIRYAAARYSGATRAKAAALAGYRGDAQALRSTGSRVDDTDTVKSLMTLAAAADAGTADKPYTVTEARLKVANLVKHSRDPLVVFKGTELLAKLEREDEEAKAQQQEMGLTDELKEIAKISRELAIAVAGAMGVVDMSWLPDSSA